MNKRMRELQADIAAKVAEAKGYAEGETKDLDKMEAVLDEVDRLQKEFDLEARLEKAGKADVPDEIHGQKKVDGFAVLNKMLARKPLTDVEKTALISGTDATRARITWSPTMCAPPSMSCARAMCPPGIWSP